MADEIAFSITTTRFDEDYAPAETSRITTNFANLARGENRRQNLRTALGMIDRRLNELAGAGDDDRYTAELDIVSVQLCFADDADAERFPVIEVLDVTILDRRTGERHRGIVGNNFSSYLRDYDFSIVLPAAKAAGASAIPDDFGDLHGQIFQHLLESDAYRERFALPPVICISVSTSRTYHRTGLEHPVLGAEYAQDAASSLTDDYFAKMGLQVRYFMPHGSVAPLAFYFRGDLVADYDDLQLAGTIATMETFQKIYRPEIYNALAVAGEVYRPSLEQADFEPTQVTYDREERSRLAVTQGRYAEEHFVTPHRRQLDRWAAAHPVAAR